MDDYEILQECVHSQTFLSSNDMQPLSFGCGCEESCEDEEVCFCLAQHSCNYEKTGCLKTLQTNEPIYECNDCCSCPSTCINRLVQHQSQCTLEVFTTKHKGNGLKSNKYIPRGTFVIEYIGEIITSNEASLRLKSLSDSNKNCYVFAVKEHFGDSNCRFVYIDATLKGNKARYINHSCDPNLVPIPVRINSNCPHIALFARECINADQELTFDYGMSDSEVDNKSNINNANDFNCKKCYCGSVICSGYLPFDPLIA